MSYLPAQACLLAKLDVGYHEGRNNQNKYSWWQYRDYYEPWCASAISKWTYDAGFRWWPNCAFGDRGDNNVGALRVHAQANNAWRADRGYIAQPGDPITLTFGIPDQHTELVLVDAGPDYEARTGRPRYATVGGNTADQVAYRSRWERNRIGIVTLSKSPQVDTTTKPLTPKEIIRMGVTATCGIPGAKVQAKGVFKGHMPQVAAVLQSNGHTQIVGAWGATLAGAKPGAFATSVLDIGKLNAPIRTLEPERTPAGKWTGNLIGYSDDFGHFAIRPTIHYT